MSLSNRLGIFELQLLLNGSFNDADIVREAIIELRKVGK